MNRLVVLKQLRRLVLKGGPGSGHHGHKGRKGQRGGSVPGSGTIPKMGDIVVVGGSKARVIWTPEIAVAQGMPAKHQVKYLEGEDEGKYQWVDLGGTRPARETPRLSKRVGLSDLDSEFLEPESDVMSLFDEIGDWSGPRYSVAEEAIFGIDSGANGIVFKQGREIVGIAAYSIEKDTLYLEAFATKRSGIGRSSMQRIGQAAVDAGADKVSLISAKEARGFYEKMGLTNIRLDIYEWPIEDIRETLRGVRGMKEVIDLEPEDGVFTKPRRSVKKKVILKGGPEIHPRRTLVL